MPTPTPAKSALSRRERWILDGVLRVVTVTSDRDTVIVQAPGVAAFSARSWAAARSILTGIYRTWHTPGAA